MTKALIHLLPLWKLWLLMVFWDMISGNALKENCKVTVRYEDIKVAAEIVVAAGNKGIKVGNQLGERLSGGFKSEIFNVEKVIVTQYEGEELKAVVAKNKRQTVIAFRGTRGLKQLVQQLKSAIVEVKKVLTFQGKTVKVMKFFWGAFETFLPKIRSDISESRRTYIIAGHSLGGALASLLAIYMKNNTVVEWDSLTSLITFGAPRVGDEIYAQAHDSMISVNRKLRIINGNDVVPHIPLSSLGYKHHSREIWYGTDDNNDVNFLRVCGEMDPPNCSNGKVNLDVTDHPMIVYQTLVDTPPFIFRDKDGRAEASYDLAMELACRKSAAG